MILVSPKSEKKLRNLMRLEFGSNMALCLREEDFLEIQLHTDKLCYKRPNGYLVTVSLVGIWTGQSKYEKRIKYLCQIKLQFLSKD